MANQIYGLARQAFAAAQIDWVNDTIKAQPVDLADYTLSIDVHDNLDDITAGARVGTAQTLTSKTNVLGVLDAADVSFPGITGDQFEAIVIYKDTGVESTSKLLFYIDTASGLPFTPNGGACNVAWANGADKIAKI